MNEDSMPTPCANCSRTVDFRDLVDDPLGEYDMVCKYCQHDRRQTAEDMQAHDYEHKMPDYQKHIH